MPEVTQPRGPVRIYIDMDAELSDAITAHCRENGIAKKFFMFKLAKDFIDSKASKSTTKKGRK